MRKAPEVKVCGLTRDEDVAQCLELGANFAGFIVYAPSPRSVSLERIRGLIHSVPQGKRVMVDVAPDPERLAECRDEGFDYFQIHIDTNVSEARLEAYVDCVGSDRLWLSPRVKPRQDFPKHLLSYASTLLVDTYSKNQIGGTGQTGDWGGFADWKKRFPEKHWVLAGGLNPQNITEAIAQTGTEHVDVNSGVESSPGIKDPSKLVALFEAVRAV